MPCSPRFVLVFGLCVLAPALAPSCSPKGQSAPRAKAPQASAASAAGAFAAAPGELSALWTNAEALTTACDRALDGATAIRAALRDSAPSDGAPSDGAPSDGAPSDGAPGDGAPPDPRQALGAFGQISTAFDDIASIYAMSELHPDKAVRDAADVCIQRVAKWQTETNLDPGLYEKARALEGTGLAPLDARYVGRLLRDFRLSGVDKDESTRKRLAELDERMVEITQDFARNLREDVRTITIADETGLAGLPADYVAAHEKNERGEIVISTDYPDFFPFQTYAEDAGLRKELYVRFLNRAYPKNEPLLLQLLALRREYANRLGFETWADYATSDKMVGTADAVAKFIAQLEELVREPMAREVRELIARKKQDDPEASRYEVWDRLYYRAKVQREKYQVDSQEVRAYFSYPNVRDGILALYGELFGVTFSRVDLPTWHPSVTVWSMQKDGAEQGRFYFDMHPRDGKYKHAAMAPLLTGDSHGRLPAAVLMCNFPDPSEGDGHALMEHKQVITFFHEFGHLIHHLLATESPWLADNGVATELDFVEAPSQLLEEWAWNPDVLARFAKHHETGAPIPASLVEKMRRADEFGKAADVGRQLFYTALSFELHERDPERLDLARLMSEVYQKYSPVPEPEGGHVYASFGHLMGYTSNYYTYQWSLVIAKDLFTRFEAEGLLDPKVAADYRRMVLAPGGTRDAKQLVREFLGRDYNLDAYRAWLSGQ